MFLEKVQNPIHFKVIGGNKFEAFIRASETFTICCGRNIAFISELPKPMEGDGSEKDSTTTDTDTTANSELLALTWIDPVTTAEVVTPASSATTTSRRLTENNMDVKTINVASNEGSKDLTSIDLIPLENSVRRLLKSKSKNLIFMEQTGTCYHFTLLLS